MKFLLLLLISFNTFGIENPNLKSAFGEPIGVGMTPIVQVKFPYLVNAADTNNTTTGSGSISHASAMAEINSGAATNSSAQLNSDKYVAYRTGQGTVVRYTALFSSCVAGNVQFTGAFNDDEGFIIGCSGKDFGIIVRRNGSDTFTGQSDFNVSTLRETGFKKLNIDITKGNVWQIEYQWLGYGEITFSVENPQTGVFQVFHRIKYANSNTTPSILNPSFPISFKSHNTTNSTQVTLRTASMAAFIQGQYGRTSPKQVAENYKSSISTTETNILTIGNKGTFASKTNTTPIRLLALNVASDGNKVGEFHLKIDSSLGGSPSYSDINTNQSVIELDTAGTTVTGGVEVFHVNVGKSDSIVVDLTNYDIFINPGETITCSANTIAASTNDMSCALVWEEVF